MNARIEFVVNGVTHHEIDSALAAHDETGEPIKTFVNIQADLRLEITNSPKMQAFLEFCANYPV